MAITEISVSKIYVLATEPTNKVKDRFWFDTTNNLLKRYDGTSWKPISVSSDDVVVLSSGNKISLTNYLNTQIAALAEGIDSKQDKLTKYTESTNNVSLNAGTIELAENDFLKGSVYIGNGSVVLAADNSIVFNCSFISGEGIDKNFNSSTSTYSEYKLPSTKFVNDLVDYQVTNLNSDISETLNGKQDKLTTYKELSSEYYDKQVRIDAGGGIYINGGEVGTIFENQFQVKAKAGIIDLDGDQFNITANEFCLSANSLSGSTTIVSAISSTARDNKIPTEKAVADAISTKQNKLLYYSEVSGNTPSATISVKNIKLKGSVAEGSYTTASGENSHAEGIGTIASGDYSHAEGFHTTASGSYQHVQGIGNIEDSNNKYADIIGNGSYHEGDDINRSNAATVSWEGISWSKTDVRAGGTDQDAATHSLSAKQNSTDTALNTTDKTIVGAINELLASINANVITSTEQKRITTTSTASGIQMSTTAKTCMVSINPVKTNVGAIYISTSSDTAPTINPLYPDQMPKYKFPDASQVYIWSDVNGDSVDLTIEYYG